MNDFSNILRKLKGDTTLNDLSKEVGISPPNLSYYMNGREPNYNILITLADHFNVSTDYLLGHCTSEINQNQLSTLKDLELEVASLKKQNAKMSELLKKINEISKCE